MDVDSAIEKARMTTTHDPDEIAATLRKGANDPIGTVINGYALVYSWSLQRYRDLKRTESLRSKQRIRENG